MLKKLKIPNTHIFTIHINPDKPLDLPAEVTLLFQGEDGETVYRPKLQWDPFSRVSAHDSLDINIDLNCPNLHQLQEITVTAPVTDSSETVIYAFRPPQWSCAEGSISGLDNFWVRALRSMALAMCPTVKR